MIEEHYDYVSLRDIARLTASDAREAQGMAARSDETLKAAQPERQQPYPKDAP